MCPVLVFEGPIDILREFKTKSGLPYVPHGHSQLEKSAPRNSRIRLEEQTLRQRVVGSTIGALFEKVVQRPATHKVHDEINLLRPKTHAEGPLRMFGPAKHAGCATLHLGDIYGEGTPFRAVLPGE